MRARTRWLKAPVFPSDSLYTKCIQLFELPLSVASYFRILPVARNFKPLIRRILDLDCVSETERFQRLRDSSRLPSARRNTYVYRELNLRIVMRVSVYLTIYVSLITNFSIENNFLHYRVLF